MKANNVKRYGERRGFLGTEGEADGDTEMGGFIILVGSLSDLCEESFCSNRAMEDELSQVHDLGFLNEYWNDTSNVCPGNSRDSVQG